MQLLHQTFQWLLGAKCGGWKSKKWEVILFIKERSGNEIGKGLKVSVLSVKIVEIVQGFKLRSNYEALKLPSQFQIIS